MTQSPRSISDDDHHVDHTCLEATLYRNDDSVLAVYADDQKFARFPAGTWDGVHRDESAWVREKDGPELPAQRLEARLTAEADAEGPDAHIPRKSG